MHQWYCLPAKYVLILNTCEKCFRLYRLFILTGSQYFGCPGKGWIDYKSSCYLLLQEKKNWKGALQYCRKQGADLASIGDKEENDFIYSQLPKGELNLKVSQIE